VLLLVGFISLFITLKCFGQSQTEIYKKSLYAKGVIDRFADNKSLPVNLSIRTDTTKSTNWYNVNVTRDSLFITGNSNVSLCRGFYDFIKKHQAGIYTWSGKRINFPTLYKENEQYQVIAPFRNYYYLNAVTFGYTMPFWNWARWEKEIDWMALHGINMPLSLIAYEAILKRVLIKMGIQKDSINEFFTGPAHLPWSRMGNVSCIDGPLSDEWYNKQIILEHKIISRMRELDMHPICPGFAGFVPKEILKKYPNTHLLKTTWLNKFHSYMIPPTDSLFQKIETAYIKEWEAEFGKCEYYLIDCFNEMELPNKKSKDHNNSDISSYGRNVFQALNAADPNAIWVMQGWMFGYQRNIWTPTVLKSFLSKIPNNKILLLDLASDYNKFIWRNCHNWEYYKGFYNKPWIYSTIPNMGGRNALNGILEYYANGKSEAMRSQYRGNLIGFGTAPEGIENNEIIYELIMDSGWASDSINLRKWAHNYYLARYGNCTSKFFQAWYQMIISAYQHFTDSSWFNWQLRPGNKPTSGLEVDSGFYHSTETFFRLVKPNNIPHLMCYDMIDWTSNYIGHKLDSLLSEIDFDYIRKDTIGAIKKELLFKELLLKLDYLLSANPERRLSTWLQYAYSCPKDLSEKKRYIIEAKRLITIWGPPANDYSVRIWSGLIRDYYWPRWYKYFQKRNKRNNDFDRIDQWEEDWTRDYKIHKTQNLPINDVLKVCQRLVLKASHI
jgi:alpha-N-acetylglucosaminidase